MRVESIDLAEQLGSEAVGVRLRRLELGRRTPLTVTSSQGEIYVSPEGSEHLRIHGAGAASRRQGVEALTPKAPAMRGLRIRWLALG